MRPLHVAACALSLSALAGAAGAVPVNLVANGSFEQGYQGWAVTTGPGAANPGLGPSLVTTDGATVNRYGDVIVSDNAVSPYPSADKGGAKAAYFVDDIAQETITQSITVATAGIYEVGFDLLATTSGSANPNDATFTATAAGVTVLSTNVSALAVNTWTHFAANANLLTPGTYQFQFAFGGGPAAAKDLVVDDVYAFTPSTLAGGGVNVPLPVPEPATAAILGAALLGLGLMRRGV